MTYILKQKEGMGFRNLYCFNLIVLAKQLWKLIHNPNSLLAKLLTAKYYLRSTIIEGKIYPRASFSWRSLKEALEVIMEGSRWQIGDNQKVLI